jgi:hypothetical protein
MENKETKPNESINRILYMDNYTSEGLTKREYFAAMAMQGFITKYGVDCQEEHIKQAVFMADFFIDELNKTKTDD